MFVEKITPVKHKLKIEDAKSKEKRNNNKKSLFKSVDIQQQHKPIVVSVAKKHKNLEFMNNSQNYIHSNEDNSIFYDNFFNMIKKENLKIPSRNNSPKKKKTEEKKFDTPKLKKIDISISNDKINKKLLGPINSSNTNPVIINNNSNLANNSINSNNLMVSRAVLRNVNNQLLENEGSLVRNDNNLSKDYTHYQTTKFKDNVTQNNIEDYGKKSKKSSCFIFRCFDV